MKDEIRKVIEDIRAKEQALWRADTLHAMDTYAIALMLDGYASRLEVAIGDKPKPRSRVKGATKP